MMSGGEDSDMPAKTDNGEYQLLKESEATNATSTSPATISRAPNVNKPSPNSTENTGITLVTVKVLLVCNNNAPRTGTGSIPHPF